MKRIISFLTFIGLSVFSYAQLPHYEITCKIDGAENAKFFLLKNVNGRPVIIDTAFAVKGMFKITGGTVDYPQIVNLVTEDRKKALSFYLENSNITITGKIDSISDAKISGSKTQDEISLLNIRIKPLGIKYVAKNSEYLAAGKSGETNKAYDLRKQMEEIMKEATSAEKEFVKSHPGSFASPEILRNIASGLQATELE